MGGHSMLPLELPKIDVPKVSFRIVHSKTHADASMPFSNSDQCLKHLKNYGYNSANTSELPPSYIRWVQPAEDELERACEYDMDEQDLEWLQVLNSDRKRLSQEPITCEMFEIVMDRLEKEWFQLNQRIQKPDANLIPVEDSRCAICEDGDTENSNAIVFCDGCNLAVHQDCYGVPYIPEGQWLCRKCTVSPDRPACELCPNSFGAFKQTSENRWAHLVCAIHIPETGVCNAMYMEPVDGVRCIPKQRWKLKCYICKKIAGACIQCANRSCCVAYHATCAQEAGLYVKMRPAGSLYPTNGSRGADGGPESSSADHVGADGVRISQSFCDKHTPKGHIEALQAAAVARLSTNSSATAESTATNMSTDPQSSDSHLTIHSKKINTLDDLKALKILATGSQSFKSARAYQKSYSSGPPLVPELIFQRLMQHSSKLRCTQRKTVINMICKYWSLKREVRRGAPLLKRLHLEPWTAAGSTSSTNEEDRRRKYGLLIAVRHDLQQVQNLVAMICEREKIKLRKAEIQKEVLEKTLFPVYQRMSLVLTTLIETDKQRYFLDPVSASEVPDYYDIIKQPMSWSIIRRKIDRFEYFRLSDFISDIHLTLTNARIYNHTSSVYHKTAIRIGKTIEPLLQDLIAFEPPSAIAGSASETFPTRRQKEHFAGIPSVLLPDRVSDLLDTQSLPSSSSRPYEEVLRERNAKRSTQSQTSNLLNLLSTTLHPQNQPTSSTNPPSARCKPPSPPRLERLPPNAGASNINNQTCCLPSPNTTQTHRGEARRRKSVVSSTGPARQRSSSIVPPLSTVPTVANAIPATPSADGAMNSAGNETINSQKKKRRRTTTDSSDPTADRPHKKAAPRIKPQSQLEEEAIIEQQNPNATRGQLISLKLRALHAKRITERERNMSDEEKARRQRLREYIRQKRLQDAQAKLAQGKKDYGSVIPDKLGSSRSQTALANQTSPDPNTSGTTPNETETSLSREISCPASNDSQSHNNNLNGQSLQPLHELWKVVDEEDESCHTDLPKQSKTSDPSHLNQNGTVSSSSPTGSGTANVESNSRTSVPKHDEVLPGIDERSDDINSLTTPTDPISLRPCIIDSEHMSNQDTSREATALPTPEFDMTPAMMDTDAEDLSAVKSDQAKITGLLISSLEPEQSLPVSNSLDSFSRLSPTSHNPDDTCDFTNAQEHSGSDSPNQTSGDPSHSDDLPDAESEQVEDQCETGRPDEQVGETASDEEMSLDVSLANAPSSQMDVQGEVDQALATSTSSSHNVAPVEDVHCSTMATQNSGESLVSVEGGFHAQIAPGPNLQTEDCSQPPTRPATRSSKKKTMIENGTAVVGLNGMQASNQTLINSDGPTNNEPVQSRQKLKIRIKKLDPSIPTAKYHQPVSETLLPELIPVVASPKLRLILEPPGPDERGSIPTPCHEDIGLRGKEKSKTKTTKSVGQVTRPEFVKSLPGEKDSFRFFNSGFILPNGTRRHHPPVSSATEAELKNKEPSHSQSQRPDPVSPMIKVLPTRTSARLKPVRLTLHHNPNGDSSGVVPIPDQLSQDSHGSPEDEENESSELSKASSTDQSNSIIEPTHSPRLSSEEEESSESEDSEVEQEVEEDKEEVTVRHGQSSHKNSSKPSATTVTHKKVKPTRAQQERELEKDERGFIIYPRAPHNSAKRVHPLARDAFTRMSQSTRLAETGTIEDGTLVWAKVAGHPWFPAEVGLLNGPAVPQSMLDKQPDPSKMELYVLVMFFDHQRSWQWVQRRNTRLLGESNQLDALLSSEAFVSNKSQLDEIQSGFQFALSNIDHGPSDVTTTNGTDVVVGKNGPVSRGFSRTRSSRLRALC
ncbi:hypothetical protein PSTG_08053 [Puccinia striiformis f. sp. tritici PST-78]|uniref:Peregrin n=1 Tax=Puccinia striiformis f. sp. tritici PST-78 TaxID=1165861 RepID=A0A0L0VI58_9BASI|nr:hypothetical protein PSTG_08053 [Puccinia striiformis f. sp. tritici PST-78]